MHFEGCVKVANSLFSERNKNESVHCIQSMMTFSGKYFIVMNVIRKWLLVIKN